MLKPHIDRMHQQQQQQQQKIWIKCHLKNWNTFEVIKYNLIVIMCQHEWKSWIDERNAMSTVPMARAHPLYCFHIWAKISFGNECWHLSSRLQINTFNTTKHTHTHRKTVCRHKHTQKIEWLINCTSFHRAHSKHSSLSASIFNKHSDWLFISFCFHFEYLIKLQFRPSINRTGNGNDGNFHRFR